MIKGFFSNPLNQFQFLSVDAGEEYNGAWNTKAAEKAFFEAPALKGPGRMSIICVLQGGA
jgi:hypothetical protein